MQEISQGRVPPPAPRAKPQGPAREPPLGRGDRVYYLPDSVHAGNKDEKGNHAWVFGLRTQVPDPARPGKLTDGVRELDARQLKDFLDVLKHHPNAEEAAKDLVPLRPAAPWPAVVRDCRVDPDGNAWADLDIQSCNGGVTLHYDNVFVGDPAGPVYHHSCLALSDELRDNLPDHHDLAFRRLTRNLPAVPPPDDSAPKGVAPVGDRAAGSHGKED